MLTCPDTTVLFDRLQARQYSLHKIQENIQCEIFGVVAEQARESYKPEIIKMLNSSSLQDMEENVEWIEQWVYQTINNS